jgi:hypothetical protein
VTTIESNTASLVVVVSVFETDTISITDFIVPSSVNLSENARTSVIIKNNGSADKTVTVEVIVPSPLQVDAPKTITVSRNSSSTTDFMIRNTNTAGTYTITAKVRYLLNNVTTEKTMSKSMVVVQPQVQQNQTQQPSYTPGNTTIEVEINGKIQNISVEYQPISNTAVNKINVNVNNIIPTVSNEVSEIKQIKLNEENTSPYYEVSGISKRKVLFFLDAQIETRIKVDASNGTIISLTKEDKNIKTLEIFSPFTLGLPGLILTVIMRMIGLVG